MIANAGVGTASDAAVAMERGAYAVLLNPAVAETQEPVKMARAMDLAVKAPPRLRIRAHALLALRQRQQPRDGRGGTEGRHRLTPFQIQGQKRKMPRRIGPLRWSVKLASYPSSLALEAAPPQLTIMVAPKL